MEFFDPQCITYSQMNLIFNARYYYRRLSTWTTAYLMSRYYGIGTTEALFERLYQEAIDLGDMLHIIFGRQHSEKYSQLLSQYAIIFHELISAQLEGDIEGVNRNVERLCKNVYDRAAFLEFINPYWSAAEYQDIFDAYLRNILETANAVAAGDFNKNIELYDLLNEHTNRMGDTFAKGIYSYLTTGGSMLDQDTLTTGRQVPCITYEQMEDIYTIRMFWFELVTWIRNYMISIYTGVGNPEETFDRLKQVPVEYIIAMKNFFPNIDVENYLQLFNEYLTLISGFITAMMENNTEELNRITRSLYENADKRAAFAASVNPFWSEEQWRDILYINLRSTIEESSSFLSGDYEKNIDIFTRLLDQAETSSTFLAQGLFEYITKNQPINTGRD